MLSKVSALSTYRDKVFPTFKKLTSTKVHFGNYNNIKQFSSVKPNTDLNSAPKVSSLNEYVHFRISSIPHPLNAKEKREEEIAAGDHTGRQQNHIWSEAELQDKMTNLHHYHPVTIGDRIVRSVMFGLYHTFNFVTGYKKENPSEKAIEWRLILLESIAGVPGFVAAAIRHFRSLRTLKRDHGWIATLLEEAENERMHLLLCLNMFEANLLTRTVVIAAQYVMAPLLLSVYLIHPKSMHRFVGYLEETACSTYVNVIKHVETPGTDLHTQWAHLAAPPSAIGYYKLNDDAKWVDTLKCMMADEANHRDVNHTFADMKTDDPNPFLESHKHNASTAWQREQKNNGTNKPKPW
eukprot:gene15504-20924_t